MSTNSTIGIGIVGMGYMGRTYAQILSQIEGARLVGVSDVVEDSARAASEAFGVPFFHDAGELLRLSELLGLLITTPEDVHLSPAMLALEAGKAVFVEKPIAGTVADGQRMAAAAVKNKALLMVGHVLRFMPEYVIARERIASGDLGPVQAIQTRRLNGKNAQDRLKGRCSLPLFLGVHDYDIARWFAGSEAVRVYAESRSGVLRGLGYNVEDTNWSLISFANNVLAACETGWILPASHPTRSDWWFAVQGASGRIDMDQNRGFVANTDQRTEYPLSGLLFSAGGRLHGAFVSQLEHFVECVRTGRPPSVTAEDGIAAVRIADAVVRSSETGRPIDL
ncbi:MAG: Gfo/Idh/MocA family protein [Chloroflexota bacterium]